MWRHIYYFGSYIFIKNNYVPPLHYGTHPSSMQHNEINFPPDIPDSPLTDHATATIDDLTLALSKFSRVPSPEPRQATLLGCCCARDDCENLKAWLAFKSTSQSRLILSAGKFGWFHYISYIHLVCRGWSSPLAEARSIRAST